MLTLGAILALVAWLFLQLTVVHGKYVTEKIATGEYDKGPFKEAEGEPDE